MQETWIILGATSAMARAFARALAETGAGLILAGRKMADMQEDAADYQSRGARFAEPIAFDARKSASFTPILERAATEDGVLNVAVFVGSMPAQADIDADPAIITGTVTDSFTGPAEFLHRFAPMMEERGIGTVVGIGSVAGDRGRIANYVYGAAKSGFHTYLSGLRNRLGRSGCHVLTVKPGPVDTPMTRGLGKQPFPSTPEAVAEDIMKALQKKRNILYTRRIWWPIMVVIRLIPERIFKKMSF